MTATAQTVIGKFVTYDELERDLKKGRRQIQRLIRDGKFPEPCFYFGQTPMWKVQRVVDHLGGSEGVRSNFDLETPTELEEAARNLMASALALRTGKAVNPDNLSVHLMRNLDPDEFVEAETEEHRVRAAYLAQLDPEQAMVVVAALFPQLRKRMQLIADAKLRQTLSDEQQIQVDFSLISNFLTLFELASRLTEHGLEPSFGQTTHERVAEFDLGRSIVLAAWMFPSLRTLFLESAQTSSDKLLLSDPVQLHEAVKAALNDKDWELKRAEFSARQRGSLP